MTKNTQTIQTVLFFKVIYCLYFEKIFSSQPIEISSQNNFLYESNIFSNIQLFFCVKYFDITPKWLHGLFYSTTSEQVSFFPTFTNNLTYSIPTVLIDSRTSQCQRKCLIYIYKISQKMYFYQCFTKTCLKMNGILIETAKLKKFCGS